MLASSKELFSERDTVDKLEAVDPSTPPCKYNTLLVFLTKSFEESVILVPCLKSPTIFSRIS